MHPPFGMDVDKENASEVSHVKGYTFFQGNVQAETSSYPHAHLIQDYKRYLPYRFYDYDRQHLLGLQKC